ncbi:hypothetical protein AJ79_00389 [Helicocarpus griseus UAMH5409]|uniref:Centrosomin N-terminal motif 1 domain-containing protein n=1 Tax=Helicocarpus griseus UAMH5409 TaxID=1447875 RepID=A0A2B7YBN6_9EURO|nr:hypothetical protein AJ79_00389 [Helicocarpus griseus UAMH5409]
MDVYHHRQRLASNGPASSPSVRAASRSQRHHSAEPSTPDHSYSSKSTAQRRSSKNTAARINTDVSRISASPSSALDTPQRTSDSTGSTPLVNPTSSLLQGLINEQRANRGARTTASEHSSDGHAQTPTTAASQEDSSSEKQRRVSNALSAGLKQPREMGMREMDQYVSKLNKLNFDLKLDIYHRTQQLLSLEKKLERMQSLEEEVQRLQGVEEELQELREVEENNQRLRESNEHLRLELDKRDQAVNEAVELICQLEAKLESLEPVNNDDEPQLSDRPHTSEGLVVSPTLTPKSTLIFNIPDRKSSWKGTSSARSLRRRAETQASSARHPRRQPSFLRESSESTSALRSLYVAEEDESRNGFSTASRTGSALSGDEQPEPESPRLSILSECSYLNASATPSRQFDADIANIALPTRSFTQPISKLELSPKEEDKNVKMSRIDEWIQPQEDLLLPVGQKSANYQQQLDTTGTSSKKQQPSLGTAFQAKRPAKSYKLDTPSLDGPIFNGGRLPPTPDTMSTSNPDARNGSNPSIIVEKSLIDQGRFLASFSRGHSLRRPRSADDITTRPSTATTSLSGTMETLSDATQIGINPSRDHLASMFPSFGQHARGVDQPKLFIRQNLPNQNYEHANQIETPKTTAKDGTSSARKKKYTPSLKSTHSERRYHEAPLTPQDWLEAALPADEEKHSKPSKKGKSKHASLLSSEDLTQTASDGFETGFKQDEPQLPSPANLRIRIAGKNNLPQPDDNELPRRRLSLRPRFFNRAVTAAAQRQTAPMSDPIDDRDGAPSPKIGRSRRMSASRRKSVNVELPPRASTSLSQCSNNNKEKAAEPSTPTPGNTANNKLETTSETTTSTKRRPTSLGLFGWMRGGGTSSSNSTSNTTTATSSQNITPARNTPTPTTTSRTSASPIPFTTPTYTVTVNSRPANHAASMRDCKSLDPASTSTPDEGGMADTNNRRASRFSHHRRSSRKPAIV